MSALLDAQCRFASLVPRLIDRAVASGFRLTLGEVYRTPEQAQWNAAHGKGIANSLHTQRLAIDVNLYGPDGYYDGSTQPGRMAYRDLGTYWKGLDPSCCWGGDFSSPDLDHYSFTFGGVK